MTGKPDTASELKLNIVLMQFKKNTHQSPENPAPSESLAMEQNEKTTMITYVFYCGATGRQIKYPESSFGWLWLKIIMHQAIWDRIQNLAAENAPE